MTQKGYHRALVEHFKIARPIQLAESFYLALVPTAFADMTQTSKTPN
jgi:hypothetical protein